MINNVANLESTFFKNHARMVLRHYKLRLSIHEPNTDSIREDQKLLLEQGRYVSRKSDILFPILKADSLYCIGSIFFGKNSDTPTIKKAIELTKLSFEAKLASQHRIETIKELEAKLFQPFSSSRSNTQVIHSFILQCSSPEKSFKFTVEFHSLVNRLALLPIESLDNSPSISIEDLQKLSNITLYVQNPEALSKPLQQAIVSYLTSPHSPDGPLFIFRSQGNRLPGFLDLIKNHLDQITLNTKDPVKELAASFVDQRSGQRIFKIV